MNGFKILLVDDEREFVDLLAKRLGNRDLLVECSYTGEEALNTLGEEHFDVVVLDVKMPGMDGVTVLKKIKDIDPDIDVILLTGHATLDTAVEGMKFDAFDYLVKPIEIDQLVQKLKDAFYKKSSPGGSGQWPAAPTA